MVAIYQIQHFIKYSICVYEKEKKSKKFKGNLTHIHARIQKVLSPASFF